MARKRTTRVTDAELAILQVLWDLGPSTVRQVWQELEHGCKVGYTTVLKQLQVMQEKGFVMSDDRARSNVYTAKLTEKVARRKAAKDLIKGVFRGSASKLMLQVLSDERASREDLLEIRKLIDELVRKK